MADPSSFTVEALAPFRQGNGAAKLGLKPLDPALWRDLGPERAPRAAAKAAIFDAHPEALVTRPPAAAGLDPARIDAAISELAQLVGARLPTLRAAALETFEDLCLLLPTRHRGHIFAAGALAYPTDWCLSEKIGLPLAGIHAPVPEYAERLATGVNHIFQALTPARMLTRTNWNLTETDSLRYLPEKSPARRFAGLTPSTIGHALWLRCERQVLQCLPHTNAALFSIGIYRAPLATLSAALIQNLAHAVTSLPPAEARRRGTRAYAAALSAYATKRQATFY